MHYRQIRKFGRIANILPNNKLHLEGQKFGKLTVKERTILKDGRSGFLCECECSNTIKVRSEWLKNGNVKSCGKCSNNTYEFHEDYVIGYGTNGLSFMFDLEDYERVSKHTWRVIKKTKNVFTTINKKTISMHKFITGTTSQIIDHIDGNPSNNRKSNLRYCNNQENSRNLKIHKNNTSGVTGVWYDKTRDQWVAEIGLYDGKKRSKCTKRCISFIDAVIQRVKWEFEYFGEFRSTRNDEYIDELLSKYNISIDGIIKG